MLLGINQGLTWSVTVIMKIDLVGPARRGLPDGVERGRRQPRCRDNDGHGLSRRELCLRPAPFLLGAAYAALGLGPSTLACGRPVDLFTMRPAWAQHGRRARQPECATRSHLTSFKESALSAACQAGLVSNLNDGVAWGLFPILFAADGLTLTQIGVIGALYPAFWGIAQLGTGAVSDRIGWKWLISAGMLIQASAVALVAGSTSYRPWIVAAMLLGLGTAMVAQALTAD